jgi:hypothetical protein
MAGVAICGTEMSETSRLRKAALLSSAPEGTRLIFEPRRSDLGAAKSVES